MILSFTYLCPSWMLWILLMGTRADGKKCLVKAWAVHQMGGGIAALHLKHSHLAKVLVSTFTCCFPPK